MGEKISSELYKMVDINPKMDRGGVAFAVLGLVLTIVGVALDPWLDFSGHETMPSAQIGLWTYKGENFEIAWTDELTAEQKAEAGWWQSEGWVSATRAMVLMGILIGAIGICYHILFPVRKHNYMNSKITFTFYILASLSILSGGAIWCSKIAQQKTIMDGDVVTEYVWTGSYGIFVWLVWIGGGCFLPAAGLTFEAGFQNQKEIEYARLIAETA